MKGIKRLSAVVMAAIVSGSPAAVGEPYDEWTNEYTAQGLLGAARFEQMKFKVGDSDTPREIDLTTMPQVGGAWGTLPSGKRLQFGLEASFLLGFQVDRLNYLYAGGGGLRVSLSSSLWMIDLAGGGYANLYLDAGRTVRLYAGGGPLLVYAEFRTDKDFDDENVEDEIESESALGLGFYARAGVEFRVAEAGMLGFGLRGTWSNLDLSDSGGNSDLAGVAAFATFTAGF